MFCGARETFLLSQFSVLKALLCVSDTWDTPEEGYRAGFSIMVVVRILQVQTCTPSTQSRKTWPNPVLAGFPDIHTQDSV